MEIIGITGNSGSGKSVVSEVISEKGGFIIDADKIAHDIILKGNVAYDEIIKGFGNDILNDDGQIDRKKLGNKVFNNKKSLELLNSITHKHIVEIIKKKIDEERNNSHSCIIVDAPLLIETNLHTLCSKVWLVYADREKRIQRIIKRDGISRELAEARIKNQTPYDKLKKYAHIITDNSGDDIEELKKRILCQFSKLNKDMA